MDRSIVRSGSIADEKAIEVADALVYLREVEIVISKSDNDLYTRGMGEKRERHILRSRSDTTALSLPVSGVHEQVKIWASGSIGWASRVELLTKVQSLQ